MNATDPLVTLQTLAHLLAPEAVAGAHEPLAGPAADWEALIATANAHLVVGALDAALGAKGLAGRIDPEAAAYLGAVAALNRARNAAILADLEQLAAAFGAAQVPFVVLKGAALLAAGLYRDPADRLMVDLDVLVAPARLGAALDAARRLGWRPLDEPEPDAAHHTPALVRPGCRARLELHHALGGRELPAELGADAVLARSVAIRLGATPLRVPAAVDLVVHNVVHAQLQHRGFARAELVLRDAHDLVLALRSVPAAERPGLAARLAEVAGAAAGFYVRQALALFAQPPLPGLPDGPAVRWRSWRWRQHVRGRLLALLILPEALAFLRTRLAEFGTTHGRRRLGPLLGRPSHWRRVWLRTRSHALFGDEVAMDAPGRPGPGAPAGSLNRDGDSGS